MEIPDADRLHDRCFYTGNSMLRVFAPGDRLQVVPVKPDALHRGDVVCFYRERRWVVHRVIAAAPDAVRTMGDNNALPDAPLTPEECGNLFKVTGVELAGGRNRRVAGGREGMRRFYRNRFRRKLRQGISPLLRGIEKLAFWRITLAETRVFGSEVHYCFRGRSVACRKAGGRVVFLQPLDRLRFRVPEGGDFSAEPAGKS